LITRVGFIHRKAFSTETLVRTLKKPFAGRFFPLYCLGDSARVDEDAHKSVSYFSLLANRLGTMLRMANCKKTAHKGMDADDATV
jgi:hypothetical protein